MSSTWRYVSEARGHLVEVYKLLLDIQQEKPQFGEWHAQRVEQVMNIVEVLEKYDLREAIVAWREHAIAYLRKTPSARSKQRFHDNDDRILFLCVTLWYARAAVDWLVKRNNEGFLKGGISYREMTAKAAGFGTMVDVSDQSLKQILPEEASIVDNLDKNDPRLARYLAWTYISFDIDHLF